MDAGHWAPEPVLSVTVDSRGETLRKGSVRKHQQKSGKGQNVHAKEKQTHR